MLLRQEAYVERGADFLDHLQQKVRAKRLLKQLESLGYNVQIETNPDNM